MFKWFVNKRRLAAIVLAAGVIGALTATAVAQSQRFPDVAPDHYAFEAVGWAAEVGVTTGYTDGTFKPQRPLSKRHAVVFMERYYDEILGADESADFTRGDMMVLLKAINDGTLRGADTTDDPAPDANGAAQSQRFPDVAPDHYAFEAVGWAAEVGVTTGYTDGTFKPQRPLSKRHAVVFMERYYDEILRADESADFTRGDMMVLLKAINATDQPELFSVAFDAAMDGGGIIAAGHLHSCAITGESTIECWGSNLSPLGDYRGQADPPASRFTAVTTGKFHSCGLRTNQTITCWGANRAGETDAPAGRFSAVSAGAPHSCGIKTDQTITCWGGYDFWDQTDAPAGRFTAVSAGALHSCAIRTDQTVTCWGDIDERTDAPAGRFTAVAAGGLHSCAIKSDQTITCWGANRAGETDAPAGRFSAVSAGALHSCAIRIDQTVTCWGSNGFWEQVSQDEYVFHRVGQVDAPAGSFIAVAAGWDHSCATRTDGAIECWGDNEHGKSDAPTG